LHGASGSLVKVHIHIQVPIEEHLTMAVSSEQTLNTPADAVDPDDAQTPRYALNKTLSSFPKIIA
jgi:hypothetical protein